MALPRLSGACDRTLGVHRLSPLSLWRRRIGRLRTRGLRPLGGVPRHDARLLSYTEYLPMTSLLSFSDLAAIDVARAGGKGANLARLAQAGFPVPSGVIVTPDFYGAF